MKKSIYILSILTLLIMGVAKAQDKKAVLNLEGTLGKNQIKLHIATDSESAVYLYTRYNTPILLKRIKVKRDYLEFLEKFPKKNSKGKYINGGVFKLSLNRNTPLVIKGTYTNPKGTKTYPVNLYVVNIVSSKDDEGRTFEELQEYNTAKHYFTVESAWFDSDNYEAKIRSVKQVNVYEKKTGKKVQSLPVPFGEYYSSACVEPTHTKPNGIQIGCCPNGIVNPNSFEDCIAFFLKNGRYEKDAIVAGHKKYERGETYCKYDKNGDIIKVSSHNDFDYFEEITYVTSDIGVKTKTTSQNLREYRCEEEIVYDAYDVEILTMPECGNPVYKRTIKKDKQGNVLSCSVETNYSDYYYKLSADGKTLLECNVSFNYFDLNGQKDLRKVEKIAPNAFGIPDDEEEYVELPFGITLNPNFKTIPKEITKYKQLREITELAPKCLVNTNNFHSYLSKEEIKKDMDNAKRILTTVDKEIGRVNILAYTEGLFEKEGFDGTPKELEKKWGKAKSKEKKTVEHNVDGDIYKDEFTHMEFNQFKIVLLDCGENGWMIIDFETSTPGFGIGGIYVGMPECNKAYLLKLFEKFEVSENEKSLSITLNNEFYSGLEIELDDNNLVKSISYTATTGM